MHPSKLRTELHAKNFTYDTSKFPFKAALEELFGCPLSQLHVHLGEYQRFKRSTDQSTLAHRVFYSNYDRVVRPIYEEFVHEVVSPIISPSRAYYQVIPTFRIGLPGNTFVGEFHKDSDYNHQSYELNFNVGLSGYIGDSALKSETYPGSNIYQTLESPYGTLFSFDHIDCFHGSEPNSTNQTIVSFDFRLALKDLYVDTNSSSVNMSTKFCPGSYFSDSLI